MGESILSSIFFQGFSEALSNPRQVLQAGRRLLKASGNLTDDLLEVLGFPPLATAGCVGDSRLFHSVDEIPNGKGGDHCAASTHERISSGGIPDGTNSTSTNALEVGSRRREISLGLGIGKNHMPANINDRTPVLLEKFSRRVNAPYYRQWPDYKNVGAENYKQLGEFISRNLQEADTIHFNLDLWSKGQYKKWLNQRARSGISTPDLTNFEANTNNITNWEYNTIINNPKLLNKTIFYGPGGTRIPHDKLPRHVVGGTQGLQ